MTTYLKLFSLFGDIYIIFNLDVPDDIEADISLTKNQHILYVFSLKFLCVIHLRLMNYHMICLFYFQIYKTISEYFYFITLKFRRCMSHVHSY
jgi:hypothetical protein